VTIQPAIAHWRNVDANSRVTLTGTVRTPDARRAWRLYATRVSNRRQRNDRPCRAAREQVGTGSACMEAV